MYKSLNVLKCVCFISLISIFGCGDGQNIDRRSFNDAESHQIVKAKRNATESFEIHQSSSSEGEKYEVGIKSSALDKEFLLQASLINNSGVVPQWNGLKSRVVAFKLKDNKVFMLEATAGHEISGNIPKNIILASFPIIREEKGTIFFDFNQGMKKVFVEADWQAQDYKAGYRASWNASDVAESYLESGRIQNDKNRMVLRQIAQIKAGLSVAPVEVKYYLTPYAPNKNFKPVVSSLSNFDQFGFFEVMPQLKPDGNEVIYATKFDTSKPIVFGISANAPKDYKQALKDGVLYWNKILGKEAIKVVDAPRGAVTPDYEYNMVQWVNWDQAGMAYADAQSDPRTGEILHAQVFMTSVFAVSSKAKAVKALQSLRAISQKSTANQFSLAGFEKNQLCGMQGNKLTQGFAAALDKLLELNATDKEILKVSQDYVREVVAHEIGHTLGLRHNFAGSLATNIKSAERSKSFNHYVLNQKAPAGLMVSSSVMEYNDFIEAAILGDQLKSDIAPFKYDEYAIKTLYENNGVDLYNDWPLFCTDSHVGGGFSFGGKRTFTDCERFDYGSSVLEHRSDKWNHELTILPKKILWAFVEAKFPSVGKESRSLRKVGFNAQQVASSLQSLLSGYYGMYRKGNALLSIDRKYGYVTDINEEVVQEDLEDYVREQDKALGGFKKVFKKFNLHNYGSLKKEFISLLSDSNMTSGVSLGGEKYKFTNEDLKIMKATGELFFDKMAEYLMLSELTVLKGTPGKLYSGDHLEDLAEIMEDRMRTVLFATDGDSTETIEILDTPAAGKKSGNGADKKDADKKDADKKDADKKDADKKDADKKGPKTKTIEITVPKYKYDFKLRMIAASLFKGSEKRSEDPDWGKESKKQIKKEYKEFLDKVFKTENAKKLKQDSLSNDLKKWFAENKQILSALSR